MGQTSCKDGGEYFTEAQLGGVGAAPSNRAARRAAVRLGFERQRDSQDSNHLLIMHVSASDRGWVREMLETSRTPAATTLREILTRKVGAAWCEHAVALVCAKLEAGSVPGQRFSVVLEEERKRFILPEHAEEAKVARCVAQLARAYRESGRNVRALACDGCERLFELLSGDDVPRGDWYCPECSVNGVHCPSTLVFRITSDERVIVDYEWNLLLSEIRHPNPGEKRWTNEGDEGGEAVI